MSTTITEIDSDCVMSAGGGRWVAWDCESEITETLANVPELTAREICILQWSYAAMDLG